MQLITSRPWLLISIVSIIILSLTGPISPFRNKRDGQPHIAPPSAVQGMMFRQGEPSQQVNDEPVASLIGNAIASAQFDIIIENGLYPNDHVAMSDDLHDAFAYVSGRFGSGVTSHFKAAIAIEENCNLHGVAYTDERIVHVFTCNSIPPRQAVAIMAHEFGHQLEQDRYGQAHVSADMILSEGAATWAAGKYWLSGQIDFRPHVRKQRDSGVFYPLATNYTSLDIGGMNALYYQWASFVDFLIQTYGRDKFDQVYVTGRSSPGSSDYTGVYGKGLGALEQEWQAWLDRSS